MVEVRVSEDTVAKWGSPIHVANHVCREFERQGVVMLDGLTPMCATGRMVAYVDGVFGERVWEWHDAQR